MDYSILVNKDNPLPRAYIPNTLENAHSEYKENILLDNKALEAFQELKREALRYGYHIDIGYSQTAMQNPRGLKHRYGISVFPLGL